MLVIKVQIEMPPLLRGNTAFIALQQAVEELTRSAPADHGVMIDAFNISVENVSYYKPHTL
ncbi:MAG: hypothetical protein M2R45_03901 [Verrucomicrobia subdivision 3 bacterium]|nr:hypothetical protein [Limisphaerales bacterium]MCS1412604.1 hypothetical protein [Limisphaerales bacterium]